MSLPKRQWLQNRLFTYDEIALRLDGLSEQVREGNYDALVILLRGGTFAGIHMAFLTGLPVYFLQYHRTTEHAVWHGQRPSGRRILLCEDSAGKGHTLANCIAFLQDDGYEVDSLVVCRMPASRVDPTYACYAWHDDTTRVLFPVESVSVKQ